MPKIKFILNNDTIREVNAPIGLSVMEIAHQNGIYEIEGACGGALSCATCHVIIEESFHKLSEKNNPRKEEEEDMLDLAFGITKTSRLSCQIIMCDELNGLIVKVPPQ